MRVLAFVIPEKGHLNPLLPTLRRIADAGHELVLASARDLTSVLAAAGIAGRAARFEAPAPPASFLTAGREFAEKLRDARWLAGWIEALLIDAVPAQLPGVEALIAHERPHVVVADPMMYAVAIGCARAGLPWAALSSSLNPVTPRAWSTALTETLDRLAPKRAALFRDAGVEVPRFFVSDAESPWLNLAFTAPLYVPHAVDPAIQLVGATFDATDIACRGDETPFPFERLRDKPRLYVSFGSQAFFQPRLFQQVFACASELGMQVIASVGALLEDTEFVRAAPPDAVLARYTPQLQLLERVDMVVSHGGANSVVEALSFGKPVLLLTLCNDQPLQARFLTASGAGLALDAQAGEVELASLRAAMKQLPTHAARAVRIGEALRAQGGPTRAAEQVLALGRGV
ncbi:MAG: glycosyltransferase [Polyangiales bacterium]